ncbi:MAG TPA: SNF2-related protein [Candidatus Xenobia bacterium]
MRLNTGRPMSDKLIRQRLLVEDLRRKRRSDDYQRYVETFRRAAVDPNPHQVDATMFALEHLGQGGALLCDEVGLGKTIEAGLVITQLRAEGRGRVLVIVPLALARQWQVELQDLFSLPAVAVGKENLTDVGRGGIVIVGREFAANAVDALHAAGPWDLAVIDEAHELFSTIYTRYSKKTGHYDADLKRGSARRAAQLKALLADTPVLLLTATPLQNNLFELWGLVQYVDRSGSVLGPFHEFCELFVQGDGGRSVADGMEETLRHRLRQVLVRCLRHQAAPFMPHPFSKRHVQTVNFSLGHAEKVLYDEVSRWLAQEKLASYRSSHRKLMALQLRRRMASSVDALAVSLANLRERMEKILEDESMTLLLEEAAEEPPIRYDPQLIQQDLDVLRHLQGLARSALGVEDQKKKLLLDLMEKIGERAMAGVASDKVVVFTESLKTLDTLAEFLSNHGLAGQITCFSGTNDRPEALAALARWEEEVGQFEHPHPDRQTALRGALVHEFRTRTRVFLATEAGAKGLNLQFCNCLVNYDLPWNPQRIEQRIGRVHRYGQKHDVVIVNFINLDNAAEQRVHALLSDKLEVFKELFGTSDDILGALGGHLDFEQRINDLLDRCPTPEAVQAAFDRLELEMDEAVRQVRDARLQHSRSLLSRLDATVRARLKEVDAGLAPALSHRDQVLCEVLGIEGVGPDGRIDWRGKRYHVGAPRPGTELGEPLDLAHPSVQAAFDDIVRQTSGTVPGREPCEVYRITLRGLEEEERIVRVGLDAPTLEKALADLRQAAEAHQLTRVDRLLAQLRARRDDAARYADHVLKELEKKVEKAARARLSAANAEEAQKAAQTHQRLQGDVTRRRSENEAALHKTLAALDVEERRIRQQRLVEAEAELLFKVTAT